jgi:hypothetical protein
VFKPRRFNFFVFASHEEGSERQKLVVFLGNPLSLTELIYDEHSQVEGLLLEPEDRLDLYHPPYEFSPHVSADVY